MKYGNWVLQICCYEYCCCLGGAGFTACQRCVLGSFYPPIVKYGNQVLQICCHEYCCCFWWSPLTYEAGVGRVCVGCFASVCCCSVIFLNCCLLLLFRRRLLFLLFLLHFPLLFSYLLFFRPLLLLFFSFIFSIFFPVSFFFFFFFPSSFSPMLELWGVTLFMCINHVAASWAVTFRLRECRLLQSVVFSCES